VRLVFLKLSFQSRQPPYSNGSISPSSILPAGALRSPSHASVVPSFSFSMPPCRSTPSPTPLRSETRAFHIQQPLCAQIRLLAVLTIWQRAHRWLPPDCGYPPKRNLISVFLCHQQVTSWYPHGLAVGTRTAPSAILQLVTCMNVEVPTAACRANYPTK
jgi:hypothetical protein